MDKRKLAILLDFDGPLFDNDMVKGEILSFLGMSEVQWKEAYEKSSKNGKYTSYGTIISLLIKQSTANEGMLWEYLYNVMKAERFCSSKNRNEIRKLANMGRVEVITQGDNDYQWLKLIASTVNDIINSENSSSPEGNRHSVTVIEENKNGYLLSRAGNLIKDGYNIIIIDDRPQPINEVWTRYPHHVIPIRIRTGKYSTENAPVDILPKNAYHWTEFSTLSEASRYLNKQLGPTQSVEGSTQSRMRK